MFSLGCLVTSLPKLYISTLISGFIEGQAIICGKSCLPAFSIGKQYDGHVIDREPTASLDISAQRFREPFKNDSTQTFSTWKF